MVSNRNNINVLRANISVLFKIFLDMTTNRSVWSIDENLTNNTSPGKNEDRSNGNENVIPPPPLKDSELDHCYRIQLSVLLCIWRGWMNKWGDNNFNNMEKEFKLPK